MSQDRRPMPAPPSDANALIVWLQDVARQVRLAWRLFQDQRVPVWTKGIPPAALAYVLFPLDIIPDPMLGLGQLDDIAVLMLGVKLFIELAPPEVVREHLQMLGARIEEWRVAEKDTPPVIEGEYKVKETKTQEPEEET